MRPVHNPPNPFESIDREWLDEPPTVRVEVYEEHTREILSENKSPDLGFRWSINPYRGCFHACAYCYARPTHEYLGLGAGTDFESKLIVKPNAAALLRQVFDRPAWDGELIVFSGNTDCYQPLEATYRLTRQCLEVCAEYRNPVGVITKAVLVRRDIDVLTRLHAEASVTVFFSIPFADDAIGRAIEPQAPLISRRFDALRAVSAAGIPTGISIAPIIPGLNDEDIPKLLQRARECGATQAQRTLLRLPGNVQSVFLERLRTALPERAARIEHRIRDVRGGKLSDSRFFERGHGHGTYWEMIEQQWRLHKQRCGFAAGRSGDAPARQTFRRPQAARQGTLF